MNDMNAIPPLAVVAHRGQPGEHENTLAAFEWAIEQGSDLIELDVRRCGDGSLVVHHDAEIEGIPLSSLSLEQIRHAKAVPTLAQTVAATQGRIRLDVELKEPGLEDQVVDCLLATLDPGDFILTAFDAAVVRTLKTHWPHLMVGLLVDQGIPLNQALLDLYQQTHADLLLPHWSLLVAGASLPAQSLMPPLMPWTVNDPTRIRELWHNPNLVGIITDNPVLALRIRSEVQPKR